MNDSSATLIVGVVAVVMQIVIGIATYSRLSGAFGARLEANSERLDKVEGETDQQWTAINTTRENVAKIKGRLGMNGEG